MALGGWNAGYGRDDLDLAWWVFLVLKKYFLEYLLTQFVLVENLNILKRKELKRVFVENSWLKSVKMCSYPRQQSQITIKIQNWKGYPDKIKVKGCVDNIDIIILYLDIISGWHHLYCHTNTTKVPVQIKWTSIKQKSFKNKSRRVIQKEKQMSNSSSSWH